jgi:hypothetical protein
MPTTFVRQCLEAGRIVRPFLEPQPQAHSQSGRGHERGQCEKRIVEPTVNEEGLYRFHVASNVFGCSFAYLSPVRAFVEIGKDHLAAAPVGQVNICECRTQEIGLRHFLKFLHLRNSGTSAQLPRPLLNRPPGDGRANFLHEADDFAQGRGDFAVMLQVLISQGADVARLSLPREGV